MSKSEAIEEGQIGQSFDAFLEEQGTTEETNAVAIKRVIAFQLAEAMKEEGLSKTEMARRLNTSRSQLDRLLDPDNGGVSLDGLTQAAQVLGRTLRLELV
ncbi:MAG: XRE family transcriptional regulator [Pseudomonadota bacterium]